MFPRRTNNTGEQYVYTWNPDWETFQHLTLAKKVGEFAKYVKDSQDHFKAESYNNPQAACLIVAPDLIFSPAEDERITKPYLDSDEDKLQFMLTNLQDSLDQRTLVIPGSIMFLNNEKTYYTVRSYFITKELMRAYDKKQSSGPEQYEYRKIPMKPGTKSGIFDYRNRRYGLEVCQDHQNGTLKNEIGSGFVNVHVLICNGQNVRHNNIVTNIRDRGLFVVCELEPKQMLDSTKTTEETKTYSVSPISMKKIDPARARFMKSLPTRTTSTQLLPQENSKLNGSNEMKFFIDNKLPKEEKKADQQTAEATVAEQPTTQAQSSGKIQVVHNVFRNGIKVRP